MQTSVCDCKHFRRLLLSLFGGSGGPLPTRLRLRNEVMAGTLEALLSGQVDLAIGLGVEVVHRLGVEVVLPQGLQSAPLGTLEMLLAVAPHHPLAALPEPPSLETVAQHRVVALADTAQRLDRQTHGIQPGQDVLTVPSLVAKLEAQIRGLGCGRPRASGMGCRICTPRAITSTGPHFVPISCLTLRPTGPAGPVNFGVRFHERYPVRFLLLAAFVPEERALRRQRQNARHGYFVLAPLENQHAFGAKNSETFLKTAAQHFLPVAFQGAIFQTNPSGSAISFKMRRIKNHQRKRVVRER